MRSFNIDETIHFIAPYYIYISSAVFAMKYFRFCWSNSMYS